MEEADRLAVGEFGIDLLQMMEHAGAAMAAVVNVVSPLGSISVLSGSGNNGAGGLCAARHLVNSGRTVEVVLAKPVLGPAGAHHLKTLRKMAVPVADSPAGDVIVDALVGYGLVGPLTGRSAVLAGEVVGRRIVSLDIPSGHGQPGAVVPEATVCLALPKRGMEDLDALYLADLGLPEALWSQVGVTSGSPFRPSRIVRL
jgi:NAD(P)H-hydrate epimerase